MTSMYEEGLKLLDEKFGNGKDNLISLAGPEQDVRYLVVFGAISVVLNQYSEIINDSQILVDDILLCCSGVFCGQDVQLLL